VSLKRRFLCRSYALWDFLLRHCIAAQQLLMRCTPYGLLGRSIRTPVSGVCSYLSSSLGVIKSYIATRSLIMPLDAVNFYNRYLTTTGSQRPIIVSHVRLAGHGLIVSSRQCDDRTVCTTSAQYPWAYAPYEQCLDVAAEALALPGR
jgi:hypothetical protein